MPRSCVSLLGTHGLPSHAELNLSHTGRLILRLSPSRLEGWSLNVLIPADAGLLAALYRLRMCPIHLLMWSTRPQLCPSRPTLLQKKKMLLSFASRALITDGHVYLLISILRGIIQLMEAWVIVRFCDDVISHGLYTRLSPLRGESLGSRL